jgi:Gly-Xaa carboxypeptidase
MFQIIDAIEEKPYSRILHPDIVSIPIISSSNSTSTT